MEGEDIPDIPAERSFWRCQNLHPFWEDTGKSSLGKAQVLQSSQALSTLQTHPQGKTRQAGLSLVTSSKQSIRVCFLICKWDQVVSRRGDGTEELYHRAGQCVGLIP